MNGVALKLLLKNGYRCHKEMILNCETLKDAHIYCKINALNGQVAGCAIENYIKTKYNMISNSKNDCIGDANKNNIDYEIKISNGGKKHNKFNFVQIRLNHVCDYLFSAYYLNESNVEKDGELFVFLLDKQSIKDLVLRYGNYAHGTLSKFGRITRHNLDNDREYCLRPKFNDRCWNELLNYRVNIDEFFS
jgi:hypothetical protein